MIGLKKRIYKLESKGINMRKARTFYNMLAAACGGKKKEGRLMKKKLPAFSCLNTSKHCMYFDPLYSRFEYDFL